MMTNALKAIGFKNLNMALLTLAVFSIASCSQISGNKNRLPPLADANSKRQEIQEPQKESSIAHATEVVTNLTLDPNCQVTPEQWEQFPPIDYTDVWDRIRSGYKLAYDDNERIQSQLKWYSRHQSYFDRIAERADPYMFGIVKKLEEHNMPLELAMLPVVESAFDPFAYSPGRASGMWQFIPATGRRYGLVQNYWYDGRRDIEASTEAAIAYLTHLHQLFDGDWLLALAAYNTGEGNVKRAIRRNKSAGKPTDFWSLQLPRETRAYVPQLLAVSQIVADPDAFNLTLNKISNSPHYAVVDIDSQIDLARAAELAEIDMEGLYILNPGFNKWATDPNGPHRLLLPLDKADVFTENLKAFPAEQRLQWRDYKIKPGDSLLKIAKKFDTSVSTLKQVNNIRGTTIRAGKSLLIPTAAQSNDHYAFSDEQRLEKIQSTPKDGRQKVNYTVKPGDSFWKIARQYDVGSNQVARWNGMSPRDKLQIGQHLVVWINKIDQSDVGPIAASIPQSAEVIRKVNYRVRNGDSLARIASKFNLTVKEISNWNTKIASKKYIQPGQLLTLWIDVTESHY